MCACSSRLEKRHFASMATCKAVNMCSEAKRCWAPKSLERNMCCKSALFSFKVKRHLVKSSRSFAWVATRRKASKPTRNAIVTNQRHDLHGIPELGNSITEFIGPTLIFTKRNGRLPPRKVQHKRESLEVGQVVVLASLGQNGPTTKAQSENTGYLVVLCLQ